MNKINNKLYHAYHGSKNSFERFKQEFIGSHALDHGWGFYFTDQLYVAQSYGQYIIEADLIIRKPFSDDKITITKNELAEYISKYIDPVGDNYLSSWGSYKDEGYNNVLWKCVNSLFTYSISDNDILSEILPFVPNKATDEAFDALFDIFGKDGIIYEGYSELDGEKITNYIVYSNNQITNRRKIYLNEAYHFGDLDYGKKADQKDIIVGQGRSTGHFGTGFYVVSFYDKSKTPDKYWNRDHWEIDLDKYYLYKPISNSQAHQLHDTLGLLDDLDLDALKNYSPTELLNELWDLEDYYDNKGILMFIKKYCPEITSQYNFRQDLANQRWGSIEDYAKVYIEDIERANDQLEVILRKLGDIFNLSEKEVKDIINEIVKNDKSNDSLGTRFMKKLGFEGVNVSHLKQDADGLSGLDNFTYGSVVYDLKSGTYRKL